MVDLNLGPYVQDQMKQAETLQKQLETLLAQQYQYEVKSREDKKTLEYLNKSNSDDEIYKGIGAILVKVKDVDSFKKEIEEDVEISEMRSHEFHYGSFSVLGPDVHSLPVVQGVVVNRFSDLCQPVFYQPQVIMVLLEAFDCFSLPVGFIFYQLEDGPLACREIYH